MPMDGFTLSYMAKELSQKLTGGRVDKVNQPSRDSLVLLIRSGTNSKLLLSVNANQARAQLTSQSFENPLEPPMFCMLMRKHLLGARISGIEQVSGDRILKITFEALNEMGDTVSKTLYHEMMGRYSDLTLVDEQGIIIDAIRHVNADMSRVRTLLPGGSYRLPPQPPKLVMGELTAKELEARLQVLSMPLSKALCETVAGMAGVCSREVCLQCGFDPACPVEEMELSFVCQKIANFYRHLPFEPVLFSDEAGNALDFFPFPYLSFPENGQSPQKDLSEAMDGFYSGRDLRMRMQQRSASLQKQIKTVLERSLKKREIMEDTLSKQDETEQNRIYGDLLTANLYAISKGADHIKLPNYYDPSMGEITIPLAPQKTANQNAQQYYKKYRKAKLAEQYAAEQIGILNQEIELLEGSLEDLEKCETSADLGEIRYVLTEAGFLKKESSKGNKSKKLAEGKPYRFLSPDGITVEVGKNALQNDRLTLHARGGEMWLHAQNIPGSHVLIRTEGEVPDATLLYAAKLATYFSKGKKHPQQAIDYTLRKYVKKGANAPAGLVTYTHFKTLIIGLTPQEEAQLQKDSLNGK